MKRWHTCQWKTPQKVQLFFKPIAFTISSIVQPYKVLYETIFSGNPYYKRWVKLEWHYVKFIKAWLYEVNTKATFESQFKKKKREMIDKQCKKKKLQNITKQGIGPEHLSSFKTNLFFILIHKWKVHKDRHLSTWSSSIKNHLKVCQN